MRRSRIDEIIDFIESCQEKEIDENHDTCLNTIELLGYLWYRVN